MTLSADPLSDKVILLEIRQDQRESSNHSKFPSADHKLVTIYDNKHGLILSTVMLGWINFYKCHVSRVLKKVIMIL